jgi:two-component system, sensor histidine kinase LadS
LEVVLVLIYFWNEKQWTMKLMVLRWIFIMVGILVAHQPHAQISYWKDPTKKISIKQVAIQRFSPLQEGAINFGKDTSYHWLQVRHQNHTAETERFVLEIKSTWLDSVHFYRQDQSLIKALSWKTPLPERTYEHPYFILPFTLGGGRDTVFYVRIYKQYLLINGQIKVSPEKQFINNLRFDSAYFGGFGGIVLIVFIFSTLLFFFQWERIYLYYNAYIVFYLCYALSNIGFFLPLYQKGIFHIPGSELKNIMLWTAELSLLLFIRHYVLGGQILRGVNQFLWHLMIGLMSTSFVLKIIWVIIYQTTGKSSEPLLLITVLTFFTPIPISYYLVLYNYVKKINPVATKTYLIGLIPTVMTTIYAYLRNLGLVKYHWVIDQKMQILYVTFDIVVLAFGLVVRYRQLRAEKERQTLLALENQLKLLQEKERISRDLHDSVGSQLTVVSTNLENAIYLSQYQKLTPQKLEGINENVRLAVQSLRDTIWVTHQTNITFGDFDKRIKGYVVKASDGQIDCSFGWGTIPPTLTLQSKHAIGLFRVIQEAIQNILKHAQATQIEILGNYVNHTLYVSIKDNGRGMTLSGLPKSDSYGLQNMQTRVTELGGQWSINSTVGQGTKISVALPM